MLSFSAIVKPKKYQKYHISFVERLINDFFTNIYIFLLIKAERERIRDIIVDVRTPFFRSIYVYIGVKRK